jgi:hypothetical protein
VIVLQEGADAGAVVDALRALPVSPTHISIGSGHRDNSTEVAAEFTARNREDILDAVRELSSRDDVRDVHVH